MQNLSLKLLLSVFLLSMSLNINAQSITDKQIAKICKALIEQIQTHPNVEYVAVSDFTTLDLSPNQLGKYLAEEFSFSLISAKKHFHVIDRSRLKELFKEVGYDNDGLLDPTTITKLGKIKGVDAILYGTMSDAGDYFRIIVKVLNIETGVVLEAIKGNITKTPFIQEASQD